MPQFLFFFLKPWCETLGTPICGPEPKIENRGCRKPVMFKSILGWTVEDCAEVLVLCRGY